MKTDTAHGVVIRRMVNTVWCTWSGVHGLVNMDTAHGTMTRCGEHGLVNTDTAHGLVNTIW